MGGTDVLKFLHKNKNREFTTTEIAAIIDIGKSSVTKCMRRLLKDPFESVNKRLLSLEEKKEKFGTTVNPKIHVYWIEQ